MNAGPARLAILRWRRIGLTPDEDWLTSNAVAEDVFRDQLMELRRLKWEPLDVARLLAGIDRPASLPTRGVVLTFDGAYATFLSAALPVLRTFRFPTVLFVATDFVGHHASLELTHDVPLPMLGWEDLSMLQSQGVSIQSMGAAHRRFYGLAPEEQADEAQRSKAALEKRLGRPVELFAFPHGDPGADPGAARRMLDGAGYRAAVLRTGGVNPVPVDDRFALSRLTVGPDTDLSRHLG